MIVSKVYKLWLGLYASMALMPFVVALPLFTTKLQYLEQDQPALATKYEQVRLIQYDSQGEKNFHMLARHMLQKEEMWLFSAPQLACSDTTQPDTQWYIESSFAQMFNTRVHFFGDVDMIDDGDEPVHLTADDFWYQRDSGNFFADGNIVYQKAQHVVHAEAASGNLPQRQLQLEKTQGRAEKVRAR